MECYLTEIVRLKSHFTESSDFSKIKSGKISKPVCWKNTFGTLKLMYQCSLLVENIVERYNFF